MTFYILTRVFFCAILATEVFKTILNMLVIALDILLIALASPGYDGEWITIKNNEHLGAGRSTKLQRVFGQG